MTRDPPPSLPHHPRPPHPRTSKGGGGASTQAHDHAARHVVIHGLVAHLLLELVLAHGEAGGGGGGGTADAQSRAMQGLADGEDKGGSTHGDHGHDGEQSLLAAHFCGGEGVEDGCRGLLRARRERRELLIGQRLAWAASNPHHCFP